MRALIVGFAGASLLLVAACGSGGEVKTSGAAGAKTLSAEDKALLARLPPSYQGADLENGEAHFSLCLSCHSIIGGAPDLTGPNLHGVFGRRAGSKTGYAFSDALKAKGVIWGAETLDAWLASPQAYVPGTKMSYPGVRDPADRRDVIAYLRLAASR